MRNFSIYRASAGSGKTYALTYNYLRLALKYPDGFKQILAVTFTNKATEEMKSRIISTLKEIGSGSHSMTFDLVQDLGIDEETLSKRAERLLVNILHNYSAFAVSTIDTFFQKIVRSFAREMGVQTGFKIELDQNRVLDEVIDQLMKNISDDPQLVKWLTEFALSKLSEGKSWETKGEITGLAKELFRESLLVSKDELFRPMESPEFMSEYLQSIYSQKKKIEEIYQSTGQHAVALMTEHGVDYTDFSYGKNGVGGYIQKVAEGEFKEPTKRTFDALEQGKWYSKSCKVAGQIDLALDAGVSQYVSEMIDHYQSSVRLYNSLSAVARNIYAFGLLSRISKGIEDYREENELLLISDFSLFLNQIIQDSDSPYIYEKTGSRYQHYLIDEFQDTSYLQWQNFRPLVFDSVSQGNFNMVVGDVKQSIYRWRGGDWKILLERVQQDIGEGYVTDESLTVNRRSMQNIVTFNNQLFEKSPKELEYHLTDKVGGNDELLKLQSAYTDASQDPSDESGQGVVSMYWVEKSKEEDVDPQELLLASMLRQIDTLLGKNYALGDITVLVRTKGDGAKVANYLIEQSKAQGKSYDFVSNETLLLRNNPAVNIILQGLSFAVDPHDPLRVAQLEYALYHHGEHASAETFIAKVRESNYKLLTAFVRELIEYFDLLADAADVPFVMGFQDAVLDYLKYESDSLLQFLDWWEVNQNRAVQLSDGQDAISIMTVHKSKGLQFKAVLIPFCDWALDYPSNRQPLLWCQTEGFQGLEEIPQLPIRYGKALEESAFSQEYYQEKNDAYLDSLNLLYVAVTRAEEHLYLGGKLSGRMANVADLVLKVNDTDSFTHEEPVWQKEIGEIGYSEYSYEAQGGQRILPRKSTELFHNRIQFRQGETIFGEAQQASIDYGEVVHGVLSQIKTRQDFTEALDKAVMKYSLSDQELTDIKAHLRKLWDLPKVSEWFDPSWEVKNEASILMDNGRLKRPDRVIMKGDRAIIIDYKTGQKSNGHLGQVKDYKRILSQMGFAYIEGYLLYLSDFEVVEV